MATSTFVRSLLNHVSIIKRSVKVNIYAASYCSDSNTRLTANNGTEEVLTMTEVKNRLIKLMGIERGYKPLQSSRSHLLSLLPTSREELPPRKMNLSRCGHF
ncbi:hypothetical protein C0J52_27872 [Blattella germanica]|nr:hypothetical protein C0J52_27872 [Blattella germanica]